MDSFTVETLTTPVTKTYAAPESFIFLVHAVLQAPVATFNYLNGGKQFTLTDKPLNCSLIDQAHTDTFEGSSGFLITPGDNGITSTWTTDRGVDLQANNQQRMNHSALLAATADGEYNQVHITKGIICGVFIRAAADTGNLLGNTKLNAALCDIAVKNNLPIATIVIQPREINKDIPLFTAQSDLYKIVIPRDGYAYRIDMVAPTPDMSWASNEPFMMRVARVDRYGVWDRNIDTHDIAIIQKQVAQLVVAPVDYPAIAFLQDELKNISHQQNIKSN